MRILITSTWGTGHVFPMLPLAHALLTAGHQVRWAAHGPAGALVTAAGIDAIPAGLSSSEIAAMREPISDHLATLPPPEWAGYAFPTMFGEHATPAMVRDLLPLAQDWRPDLMVHEQAELGSALVGALIDVPSVTHSFGGAVPPAHLVAATEVLRPLWADHGRDIPPHAGSFESLYLDICPTSMQTVPLDHIGARQPLRPVQDNGPSSAPLPDAVTTEDDRPLVYLTLGTVSNHAPALVTAAAGLARLDARVLIAVGKDGDPELLGSMPGNVTVATWVDQAAVLPHCSVVASHAGSGTFFGALARGLPQLCLPQAADQFRNSAAAVRSGVGLVLAGEEVTADAVHDAVRRLLTEDGFRSAAQGVAAEIAAMPSPDDAVPVLERLVTG